MATMTTSNPITPTPGKGTTGTLSSGLGLTVSTPVSANAPKKPKGAAAGYRRYIRKQFGVADIRKATPEQIKAFQAKGLLPGGKKIKVVPSRTATMAAAQSIRTSRSSGGARTSGGGSD